MKFNISSPSVHHFMVKKILFMNGPSQDPSDRFFGWPTSLLNAIGPSVQAIKDMRLNLDYYPKIFEPLWYLKGKNDWRIMAEFRERIADIDIICGSATYDALYPTMQLFSEAKKLKPDIVNIFGGPYLDEVHNLLPYDQDLMDSSIDFAIAGDGEYALRAVLESLVNERSFEPELTTVPGRAWIYHDGKQYATSGSKLEMDKMPFLPIELVDRERHNNDYDIFRDKSGKILPTVQMIAMRGCVYDCIFCSERREQCYPNPRSIDNIIEEVELRKQQGFKAIFFDDSTFGAYQSNQGNVLELLSALSKTGMKFGCLNRFDHLLSGRIVQAYADAGFDYVYCSIEQFDDIASNKMSKRQQKTIIEKSMEQLNQQSLRVGVSLLCGLPFETKDSIQNTLDFTQKWVQDGTVVVVSESALSYHPGTPIGNGSFFNFNRTPPNIGYPFNEFEEGQWYHPKHVTAQYLDNILRMSEDGFKDVMVRHRHSWHAEHGQ
jgi:radical SAM superfamily enzyme YgiQ (UPF0313 family)